MDAGILPTHISSGCCRSWDDSGSACAQSPAHANRSSVLIFELENTVLGVYTTLVSPWPLWLCLRPPWLGLSPSDL